MSRWAERVLLLAVIMALGATTGYFHRLTASKDRELEQLQNIAEMSSLLAADCFESLEYHRTSQEAGEP